MKLKIKISMRQWLVTETPAVGRLEQKHLHPPGDIGENWHSHCTSYSKKKMVTILWPRDSTLRHFIFPTMSSWASAWKHGSGALHTSAFPTQCPPWASLTNTDDVTRGENEEMASAKGPALFLLLSFPYSPVSSLGMWVVTAENSYRLHLAAHQCFLCPRGSHPTGHFSRILTRPPVPTSPLCESCHIQVPQAARG